MNIFAATLVFALTLAFPANATIVHCNVDQAWLQDTDRGVVSVYYSGPAPESEAGFKDVLFLVDCKKAQALEFPLQSEIQFTAAEETLRGELQGILERDDFGEVMFPADAHTEIRALLVQLDAPIVNDDWLDWDSLHECCHVRVE